MIIEPDCSNFQLSKDKLASALFFITKAENLGIIPNNTHLTKVRVELSMLNAIKEPREGYSKSIMMDVDITLNQVVYQFMPTYNFKENTEVDTSSQDFLWKVFDETAFRNMTYIIESLKPKIETSTRT